MKHKKLLKPKILKNGTTSSFGQVKETKRWVVQVWKKPSGEIVMTSLHKIYIQSRLPWIHRQYNGFKSWLQDVLTVISTGKYSVKDVNTVGNTGTPRAIDGSHGFWPSPPLRNRKRGNYPDYFRFWAERAIIAIISDHCWANGNFFIGQQSTTGWQQIVNAVNRVCGRESGLTAKVDLGIGFPPFKYP